MISEVVRSPEPIVVVAESDDDVRACWEVYRQLRPHLDSVGEFVERYHRQQAEGFELAFVRDGAGAVAGAAGFRLMHTMAWGRICYLDDLIVDAGRRGTGLGTLLLRFVQQEALRRGCDSVHLDTGYGRHSAHRSYLRNGFDLICHHLEWRARDA
ncbi:MAG TPA: GNAT family N-acetyltransferase [Micromonosporaceae bacterium]|nr:GNAT family N-acetyltransferase [Micromonosporaceae bacterium]